MHLILTVGHPFDLAVYYRLIPVLKKHFTFKTTILLARTYFFREFTNYQEIAKKLADEVCFIEADMVPRFGWNLPKHIINSLKLLRKIKRLKTKDSFLFLLDKSSLFANISMSRFKKIILIQHFESIDTKKHYTISKTWTLLINFYTIALGLIPYIVYKNREAKKLVYFYKPLRPLPKPFCLSEFSGERNIVLPQVAIEKKQQKVILFGSRFNNWGLENLPEIQEQIANIYKQIVFVLKSHQFFYKPHPLEKGSEYNFVNKIFGGRLVNLGIALNSELLLIENPDFNYCFSLGSTSSVSAFEMGFSSKVFYKTLTLPPSFAAAYDSIFDRMPQDFFLKTECSQEIQSKCEKRTTPYLDELITSLKK